MSKGKCLEKLLLTKLAFVFLLQLRCSEVAETSFAGCHPKCSTDCCLGSWEAC